MQATEGCQEKLSLAIKKCKIKWKSGFCSLIFYSFTNAVQAEGDLSPAQPGFAA